MTNSNWLTPTLITSAVAALGGLASTAIAWINWREQRRRPAPDVVCTVRPTPIPDWWELAFTIVNNTDRIWEIESLSLDRPRSLVGADSTGTKKRAATGFVIGKYEYLKDAECARGFEIGIQLYPTSVASARGGELQTDFFLLNPGDGYKAFSATLRMASLDPRQRRKLVRIRRRFGQRLPKRELRQLEPDKTNGNEDRHPAAEAS